MGSTAHLVESLLHECYGIHSSSGWVSSTWMLWDPQFIWLSLFYMNAMGSTVHLVESLLHECYGIHSSSGWVSSTWMQLIINCVVIKSKKEAKLNFTLWHQQLDVLNRLYILYSRSWGLLNRMPSQLPGEYAISAPWGACHLSSLGSIQCTKSHVNAREKHDGDSFLRTFDINMRFSIGKTDTAIWSWSDL